jgi:uncharacterized membrane protein YccC
MRVVSLVNADAFTDPADGTEYRSANGAFDLPEPLGRELTTHHASLWREQTFHESQIAQEKMEELRNPHNVAPALADLRDRVAALEATVAALAAAVAQPSEIAAARRTTRTRKAVPEQ